mmetsp:Transcript_8229/g.8089  ORF Transcript_8229/g.8089 Transcript_8229/m.8089 type:complete len:84 (+) Transcript_8229:261-512(+)
MCFSGSQIAAGNIIIIFADDCSSQNSSSDICSLSKSKINCVSVKRLKVDMFFCNEKIEMEDFSIIERWFLRSKTGHPLYGTGL